MWSKEQSLAPVNFVLSHTGSLRGMLRASSPGYLAHAYFCIVPGQPSVESECCCCLWMALESDSGLIVGSGMVRKLNVRLRGRGSVGVETLVRPGRLLISSRACRSDVSVSDITLDVTVSPGRHGSAKRIVF